MDQRSILTVEEETRGCGIGLRIVAILASLLLKKNSARGQGDINIESQKGVGTTFTVTISDFKEDITGRQMHKHRLFGKKSIYLISDIKQDHESVLDATELRELQHENSEPPQPYLEPSILIEKRTQQMHIIDKIDLSSPSPYK